MSNPQLVVVTSPALTQEQSRGALASVPKSLIDSGLVHTQDLSHVSAASFADALREIALSHVDAYLVLVFEPIAFVTASLTEIATSYEASDVDLLYFDSRDCRRPVFSPERLRGQDYLGGVLAVRAGWFIDAELLQSEHSELLKLQLAFDAVQGNARIQHSTVALYRERQIARRELSPEIRSALRGVLQSHLDATGGGEIVGIDSLVLFPTKRVIADSPLVSIVIPSQGLWAKVQGKKHSLLLNAVKSIHEKSTYTNLEYVVVVDEGADADLIRELQTLLGDRLRIVRWEHPFNFSQKMNLGVVKSHGEYVVLLNDDVEVISPDWIESMLALAQRPNAGLVGSMLYFEDETIQHAGHAYYQGSPTHIAIGLPRGSAGPMNGLLVERELSGVTAACSMMSREVFMRAGGFTSLLPGGFNDVDLCMKVGMLGYDIYWTPFAELYHFESKTRDAQVHFWELDIINHRWGHRLHDSRFWPGHPHSAE